MMALTMALVALAGAAAVAIGLWWVYPPAALVAVGAAALRFTYVWSGLTSTIEGDGT